jgi:hypothetical protein
MTRRRWIGVVAIASLLGALAFLGRAIDPPPRTRYPSSVEAAPEGLLAFRRLLVELDVPATLWTDSWEALDDEEPTGMLVVATPLTRPPTTLEAGSLREWVSRGGALLVVDDATELERSVALDRMLANLGLGATAPLADVDRTRITVARPETAPSRGTPALPSSPELAPLFLHATSGLAADGWAVPLAVRDDGLATAGSVSLGHGAAARVLGALLANDRIADGANLDLALRLVERLRGAGPVRFDEYHHGRGGLLGGGRVRGERLAWAGLQALGALLLFAVARGVRFGPLRDEPRPARRSSLEFVHSMAALYRRAGARAHVVAEASERFVREARARSALPEDLAGPRLAQAIAAASGVDAARVATTLERADRAAASPVLAESEMVACVRELHGLEQEAWGGTESRS